MLNNQGQRSTKTAIKVFQVFGLIWYATKTINNLLKDGKILIFKVFFLYQKSAKYTFLNMTIGDQLLLLTYFDNLDF